MAVVHLNDCDTVSCDYRTVTEFHKTTHVEGLLMNQYIIFMKNQLYTLYINIQHLLNLTEAMVLRLILMNYIHQTTFAPTGSTFGVGIDNKIVRNVNENLFSYLVSSGL